MTPSIALIAALSRNRVIGVDNRLPWHLPADLQRFKALTLGHPILMGRRTYDSIGRPLPGRRNIILSRSAASIPGCEVVDSLEAALRLAERPLFVIGGAEVYNQALAHADTLYLTEVATELQGDALFPELRDDEWLCTVREPRDADDQNPYAMQFQVWRRK